MCLVTYDQGYFCDRTLQNAVPEILSQKDASWNRVPEPFFPGIGITNTIPLQPNAGSLVAFQNLFQNKNSTVCGHVEKLLLCHKCVSDIIWSVTCTPALYSGDPRFIYLTKDWLSRVMLQCFSSVSPGKLYIKISHNFHAMTCNHPTVWHHITSALKKGHCKSGIYV
jgi:hypothetical protein